MTAKNVVQTDEFAKPCTPEPQKAWIFEIELDPKLPDVGLTYGRVSEIVGLKNRKAFFSEMKKIISGPACNEIVWQTPTRTRDTDAGIRNKRKKDTRLSIKGGTKELLYVVFKLSDKWNWQFASNNHPVMIERKDFGKCLFVDAHSFDENGDPVLKQTATVDGCKYAYFILDGRNTGSLKTPDFQHNFNIYIELLERFPDGSIDSRMPIIIDPDVRHPGGTGP